MQRMDAVPMPDLPPHPVLEGDPFEALPSGGDSPDRADIDEALISS
jgi:hypothetical protein